jgi:tRNA A-37 threonylcarbamoyl transferase component Bud32
LPADPDWPADPDCPSDAVLSAFNSGKTSDVAVEEAIANHLLLCAVCEARLARLSRDGDSVLRLLAAPDPYREFADGTHNLRSLSPTKTGGADELDDELSPDASEAARLPEKIGKYFVLEEVGKGGFGRVFKAKDPDTNRIVAIKVPRLYSKRRIAEFLDEARTAAQLTHQSIVQVYDWGRSSDGLCFVVMEYMEGGSLKDLLKSVAGARPRAVEVVVAVAEALHYAHGKGVYHRDVKPANILFDARGLPHLADFGLAIRDDQRWNHQGDSAGTDAYMAPEQVRGDSFQFDGRTDIWSLGVVFYEMLTGRRPFSADSRKRLFVEILNRDPTAPHAISVSVSPALSDVCLRCLRRNIAERYASGADLAKALNNVSSATGESPSASPAGAALPPSNRKLAAIAVAGPLLLLAAVLLVAALDSRGLLRPARAIDDPPGVGSVEAVDNDNLARAPVPFRWYPLLAREPTALFLPDLQDERLVYDRDLAEVVMQSPSFSHLILGETTSASYRIQVDMTKIAPQGESGILFGLQPSVSDSGNASWNGQVIRLISGRGDDYEVRRELVDLVAIPQGGTYAVHKYELKSVKVPHTRIRGETLEITIDPGRVSEVRWGGRLLPELCDPLNDGTVAIPECRGKFGLVNSYGSVTFRNARYMSLKGERP